MFLAPKNRTSQQYLDQLESNNVAKCLAKIFMTKTSEGKRAAKIGQRISFLESRAVRVTKQDGQIVWYNMEKVIDGTFDKWTDNNGSTLPWGDYRSLTGLLEHLLPIVGMNRRYMHESSSSIPRSIPIRLR